MTYHGCISHKHWNSWVENTCDVMGTMGATVDYGPICDLWNLLPMNAMNGRLLEFTNLKRLALLG